MKRILLASIPLVLLAVGLVAAGNSGLQITQQVFNAGGHPTEGQVLSSASFRIPLGAIGEAVSGGLMCSAQFCIDSGSIASLRPPAAVENLHFVTADDLSWDPVGLADSYNLYRDDIATLPGGYGVCLFSGLIGTTATVLEDPTTPGEGFFYLVTAVSSQGGESSKGTDSFGGVRTNPAACE